MLRGMRLLYWGWYGIGAVLMLLWKVPERLSFSSGLFLVWFACYAMALYLQRLQTSRQRLQAVIGAVLIGIGGMAVEWIGTRTGRLFGSYTYTDTLGIHWQGVPVTLGMAWIAVVACSAGLAGGRAESGTARGGRSGGAGLAGRLLRAPFAGLWALLLDLVLDPAAQALAFWHWSSEGIPGFYEVPWTNFACWLLFGALFSLLLPPLSRATGPYETENVRLYQGFILLFGLLALKEGLPVCAAIAAAAVCLVERRYRRHDQGESQAGF